MGITHIMKDGTVLNDITGHVIKKEDCPLIYEIIKAINKRVGEEKNDEQKS